MLSMHLRQLFRKPTRTALYLAVLILLTAFFCMSFNLYKNSEHNLKLADETYTTIAIMELYAEIDNHGNLISDVTTAEDYAGRYAMMVYDYDLEPIISAPSVKKYELRARYGAFSENNIALKENIGDKNIYTPYYSDEVIRFKINSDDTPAIHLSEKGFELPDHSSAGLYIDESENKPYSLVFDIIETATYAYLPWGIDGKRICTTIRIQDEKQIKKYKNELDKIEYASEERSYAYLEPETEYIGNVNIYCGGIIDMEADEELGCNGNVSQIVFEPDNLFVNLGYVYGRRNGIQSVYVTEYSSKDSQPFWLYRYEDVVNEPELMKKYEQISRAYYITSRSFAVMTTNDITGIPAFNLGYMYIKDGLAVSDDEFASGANVCMISKELAMAQGWEVGTKIKFNFYEYDFFSNAGKQLSPRYTYTSPDNFFDSGEYEVVGIYDVRPMTGSSTISEAAISVPWNTIYIPERSLENAPAEEDRPVTGALLTIWLENGKIEPFIERMNELGITGAKQGDYEARFTFYDQGYSRIQPSLEALSGTAELLLILSSSLLVIAALLLAFFYAQSQKQSIGTMRLLGCSKARAFAAVMLSALIIAVTGALIGAAIGHALTASVGESIMANANQTPEEFLAFSAYLAESTQVEVEFALGADAKVSMLTCIAALGLFIVGTLVFVIRYLGKGPRELLPRAGE